MMRNSLMAGMSLWASVCLSACCWVRKEPCPDTLLPVEALVYQNNANADKVDDLWARARVDVKMTNERGLSFSYTFTGANLVVKKRPEDPYGSQFFRLSARETGQEVFRLGSDPATGTYYFWYDAFQRTGAWWGRLAYLYMPGVEGIPVDPTQVVSVLGITPWQVNLDRPPFPVLEASADPCAFVMRFLAPRPGRRGLYVQREVLLDRRTPPHRPIEVRLLDPLGRRVMTAKLSEYQAIDTGAAEFDRPIMPTDIKIDWPLAKASMRLRLTDLSNKPRPLWVYRTEMPDVLHDEAVLLDRAYGEARLPGPEEE